MTGNARKEHLIQFHKFPESFEFFEPPKKSHHKTKKGDTYYFIIIPHCQNYHTLLTARLSIWSIFILLHKYCLYLVGPAPTTTQQDNTMMMMECADDDMDALGDALSNLSVKVPASISFGRGGRGRGRRGGSRGT